MTVMLLCIAYCLKVNSVDCQLIKHVIYERRIQLCPATKPDIRQASFISDRGRGTGV